MTAIELTPATLSHLARFAGLADVDAFSPGDYSEHCDVSEMFALWLGIAVDDIETERERELAPLHEARLLLDRVAAAASTDARPVPPHAADPRGEHLLTAVHRLVADSRQAALLEQLFSALARAMQAGRPAPLVRVDLFRKGSLMSTVWLDETPRTGEVPDLDVDGVPCCRVVTPAVRRGPGHVEVHVRPFHGAADGGEF